MSLNNFVFDGKSRGRRDVPQASEGPLSFLKQTGIEREKWLNHRKREAAALKIQTRWRRYTAHKRCSEKWRQEFDEVVKLNSDGTALREDNFAQNLSKLLERIQFFFSPKKDEKRLVFVCQQLLAVLRNASLMNEQHRLQMIHSFRIKRFLVHCLDCIEYGLDTHSAFGPPLRVIQEYALKDNGLIVHIVSHGLMSKMLSLLKSRIRPLDLPDPGSATGFPGLPMAETVLDVMLEPLQAFKNVPEIRLHILVCLNREVLSIWPCPPVVLCYIIPQFCRRLDVGLFTEFVRAIQQEKVTPATTYFCISALKRFNAQEIRELDKTCRKDLVAKICEGLEAILTDSELYEYFRATQDNSVMDDDDELMFEKPKAADFSVVSKPKLYVSTRCMELLEETAVMETIFDLDVLCDEENFGLAVHRIARVCHVLARINGLVMYSAPFMYKWSFQPRFMQVLWQSVSTYSLTAVFGVNRPLLDEVMQGRSLSVDERDTILPLLALFCTLTVNLMQGMHDHEFWDENNVPTVTLMPFSLKELKIICAKLRNVALGLIDLAFPDSKPVLPTGYSEAIQKLKWAESSSAKTCIRIADPCDAKLWSALFQSVVKLLQMLHERDTRLQFCGDNFWSYHHKVSQINSKMFVRSARGTVPMFDVTRIVNRDEWLEEDLAKTTPPQELRTITILRQIPFIVPFNDRVTIFQSLVKQDKTDNSRGDGHFSPFSPSVNIRVRRNYIYEDSFQNLSPNNVSDMRSQLRVQMTNWAGAQEAGVDGGGLFREFLNAVLKSGFDPTRGLFTTTPEHALYPNPISPLLYDDYERHYFFLGRLLGKLLYENQMAELRFASFFLWKIQSSARCVVDIHHLKSLDPVLHKNLLALKFYDGDCTVWELDFSVLVDEMGCTRRIDLKPDGSNILVTNSNKLEYISLVVDFYLNKRIHKQTLALRLGMADVIDVDWLGMFGYRELQMLISGVDEDIQVADMRHHTNVGGLPNPEVLEWFWTVVGDMDRGQRSKLLKFITSCSRPPLLGFKDLHPPLSIQICSGADRLPTAMTCMNLLKLPSYPTIDALREKLVQAIEAEAGFELS